MAKVKKNLVLGGSNCPPPKPLANGSHRETPVQEMEPDVPYNPDAVEVLAMLHGRGLDPSPMMTASEREEISDREFNLRGPESFIEGQPNTHPSEPVMAEKRPLFMKWTKEYADLVVSAIEELLLDESQGEREAEVRFFLEYINDRLCTWIREMRQCGRPTKVSRAGSKSRRSPRAKSKSAPALRSSSHRSRTRGAGRGKLIQWPTQGRA